MAKVWGPLLSFEARGSIGNRSITFYNKGYFKTCVKIIRNPPKANKPKQIANQKIWKILQCLWDQLTEDEKMYWKSITKNFYVSSHNPYKAPVSGRNLFFQWNYWRLKRNLQPTKDLAGEKLFDVGVCKETKEEKTFLLTILEEKEIITKKEFIYTMIFATSGIQKQEVLNTYAEIKAYIEKQEILNTSIEVV